MTENMILLAAAFLLGSVPSGYLIGRFVYGVDLRKAGSGNTGATNAGRALGKRAGICTLLADVLKGVLAVLLPCLLSGICQPSLSAFAGLLAILGHCYSPFLKFQGGKGIATSLGVFLMLAPAQTGIVVLVFIGVFYFSRIVSLASLLGALTLMFTAMAGFPRTLTGPTIFAALTAAALAIYRHKSNIQRLLVGQEPRYDSKV